MADNVTLNPGTGGAVIATDDIDGVQYQRVKLAFGANGVADDVSSATPLPVSVSGVATEATLSALNAKTPGLGFAAPGAAVPVNIANDLTVTGTASIAAINTNLLTGNVSDWYDAQAFHSVSIQIIGGAGISAGAIIFEQTNDTTAAPAGNVWPVNEDTTLTPTPVIAAVTIAASAVRMFGAPITSRYVRVRVSTGFVGGTVQAVAVFGELPYQRQVVTVHQATAANLNATVSGTVTANQGTFTAPTPSNVSSTASTNATSVKSTAGTVYSVTASNTGAAAAYLKLYNLAAAPTVGTSVPVLTITIPASGTVNIPFGTTGHRFATGIALAITGSAADSDTTAVAAAQVKVLTAYI
jgi:hypothetical protein